MDEELKSYLRGMEDRLDARFEAIDKHFDETDRKIASTEERLVNLMASEVGNVHSEIGELRADMARMNERLDRQGFMLAGGTKALGGLLEHVVNVDSGYEKVLSEMSELRARVDRLEKKAS